MELVKTHLELLFCEAFNPWLEMRNIIRNVGGKPSAEIQGAPLIIDLRDRQQRAVFHIKAFEFMQEGMNSIEDSVAEAVDKLEKANSASGLPRIRQISYESIFIEPYVLPFHELLILMKSRFFQPSALVDATTDVGLIFDQTEGDVVKHFQTGPMGKEQLQEQYLTYPREKLPDNFIFLSVMYVQNKEFKFESEYVRKFLNTAITWQTEQAKLTFAYLKKGEV